MEHIVKQIKKGAKHTRLTAMEKAEMRNVLVRHVKANPVSNDVLLARGIPSSFFNINNFRNKKGISILVIGGLLMGGTVSFAAESTVPGDALFNVKVYVNENVRGAVAVTSKAKAEWEVKLVERRLEEVEKLAMTPDVPPEVQQIAEQNLEHYSERVKNRIEKFDDDEDDEDAIEVASNLSEVFNAHEQVLLAMNVPATATTTVVIATSTPVAIVQSQSVSNESIKGTIKKVQGARGDAEKKHKELKEKYSKEKIEKEEKVATEALQKEESRMKPSKSRASDNNRKQKDERKEEFRSTVTTEQATSTPSVLETPEQKKEENKKIEEIRKVEDKDDDND